jgi:3',5'-cyclic AMP phosphodiesterase CpdA
LEANIMQIAHLSDLHFGRIAHDGIVDALVAEVNEEQPALVALSGDLTQRARHREYERARALLNALDPPTLVVPGNHDVYPWWRPVRRLLTPLRRYRRYVTGDLRPTFSADGVQVMGISTAYGLSVKGGRVRACDRRAVREYFRSLPERIFKILVLHHHLTELQTLGPHDVAWRARQTLDAAGEVGVDLILCGHLHVSHIEPHTIIPDDQRIVVASAGTATSNRWRSSQRPTNFYNLITVEERAFQIEERRFVAEEGGFVSDSTSHFNRVFSVETE